MLYCSSLVDIMSTMGSLQFNSKGWYEKMDDIAFSMMYLTNVMVPERMEEGMEARSCIRQLACACPV